MGEQAKFARLRAAVEACPFKSWAAFTDDSGATPHTNLVSFVNRTECVLALPGRNKREPLVEFLAAATPKAVAELLAERDALEMQLSQATRFELPHGFRIEQRRQIHGGPLWVVSDGSSVLNREGEWVYEPLPSSRTDDFIQATRFTLDEARAQAEAALKALGQDGSAS